MADVEISYKGNEIATMSATGVKTLLTGDTFCEDDIIVSYTKPATPTPTLQSKTVSPSTSQQTVSPDSGYDGLSSVTVNAMPSGSASTPATSITANPTISVSASGLITASVSGSKSVTPSVSAGYVSSGTAGTVSVSGSNTSQLSTQSAQTITPTTTNQTIASGKYLTGTQTILGDANLLAENIKKDVVIFGITGTHEGGGGGGVTTVSFSNDALFGSDKVIYVDGTGTVQIVDGMLAMFSACSYQMMSGSTIVMFGDLNGGGAQFMDVPSTITLINSGTMTISASRGSGTLSWAVFQVN